MYRKEPQGSQLAAAVHLLPSGPPRLSETVGDSSEQRNGKLLFLLLELTGYDLGKLFHFLCLSLPKPGIILSYLWGAAGLSCLGGARNERF